MKRTRIFFILAAVTIAATAAGEDMPHSSSVSPSPPTDASSTLHHNRRLLADVTPTTCTAFDELFKNNAVSCVADNSTRIGGEAVIVSSDGLPGSEVDTTGETVQQQNWTWKFPLKPKVSKKVAIPLVGPIAVAIDGLPIFGPTVSSDDLYRDPVGDLKLVTEASCGGHSTDTTEADGVWHFHLSPDCILTGEDKNDTIIGYAFDGYPIYTRWTNGGTELMSSYQLAPNDTATSSWGNYEFVEGSGDLDVCNGYWVPLEDDCITSDAAKNQEYHYVGTAGFPYFMGCYRGKVMESNWWPQPDEDEEEEEETPSTPTPAPAPPSTPTPAPTQGSPASQATAPLISIIVAAVVGVIHLY